MQGRDIFKIVPTASTGNGAARSLTTYRVARPSISSVKKTASGKMTVRWGKNAKASGYQIQYSTSKTFAKGNKTAEAAKASTVSKVIGSLKKGKTYYVRIRTCKTVAGKKYWSAWSAAKSMKTR
ncbi:MAG: fibronectin type III domain-containing protein [Sarcina sp.]|nr:fibronectin type III domain-containing protein [Sarcina sp.]